MHTRAEVPAAPAAAAAAVAADAVVALAALDTAVPGPVLALAPAAAAAGWLLQAPQAARHCLDGQRGASWEHRPGRMLERANARKWNIEESRASVRGLRSRSMRTRPVAKQGNAIIYLLMPAGFTIKQPVSHEDDM